MAVVLLPLGAVEKHGPHLPLDTDTRIAVALARRVAPRLGASVAPPFTDTAASCAADFPGTVSVDRELERHALAATLLGLRGAGAERVVLVNVHFDPEHLAAVRAALADVEAKDPGAAVFPDFTRRAHAQRVGGEFATGDCHAGEFETSLMLAVAPEAVAPTYRGLPPKQVGLVAGLRAGKRTFRELGMHEGYCGHPATATPQEGERLLGVLADLVAEAVTGAGAAAAPR